MTPDLLDYVRLLSLQDKKTLSQKALKTGEEFGELAKVVLPYDNAFATTHRFVVDQKILEECVDVMLCALSIAYDLGFQNDDIDAMMHTKAAKWASLQEKSSVEYPLPYEIHVTVSDVHSVDAFRRSCHDLGVKPIVLDLQNQSGVVVMGDVMTSSKHFGDNRSAYEEAMRIRNGLMARGLNPIRVKIESVPWHPAAPKTDTDTMPPGCYFESHLPINITEEAIPSLRECCHDLNLHVSRNVFKKNADGTVVVMTTYRKWDCGYETFAPEVAYIISVLEYNGFIVGKSIVEFSVYDTNNSHDALWLTSN